MTSNHETPEYLPSDVPQVTPMIDSRYLKGITEIGKTLSRFKET